MKLLWTRGERDIMDIMRDLIREEIPLILQGRNQVRHWTRLVKVQSHNGSHLLLMWRPPSLPAPRGITSVLFKPRGLPIMGFSCPIVKASAKLLATVLPMEIFQHELRLHPRLPAPEGSRLLFNMRGENPDHGMCQLKDLSKGGAKLWTTVNDSLRKDDMIGPCTVSIADNKSRKIISEVNLHKGNIVRAIPLADGSDCLEIGVKFDLLDDERKELEKQLLILSNRHAKGASDGNP